MNKLFIRIIPFLVLVLFSCQRKGETTPAGKDLSDVVFYATYEDLDPDTRTILQSDGSILWDAHEEISIILGDKSARFVSTNTEPAATVEFHGSLEGFEFNSDDLFWGVYPYSASNKCDGETLYVDIPSRQQAKDGTFDRNYFISVARRSDFNLYFANVCGGIRFVVNTPGIDKITIHSRGGESMTGTVDVVIENGAPIVKAVYDGTTDLEVIAPNGKTFTPGVAYYAVAIPRVYSQGFDFTFHAKNKKATTWINKSLTVKRGIFGTVTDIDKGLYFKEVPASGNISFADDKLKAALVAAYDTNGDGELSFAEADAVTTIDPSIFGSDRSYTSFDEFQYFTSLRLIPPRLFKDWIWMTSIKLPESINYIEYEAFRGCSRLKSLTFGSLIQWINFGAFEDCSSLESLVIPDSVKNIYINNDWSINPVDFNDNMGVFQNCTSLKTVKLGQSLHDIPALTFRGCTALQTVIIGDSVESIGEYAFDGCRSLKNIQWGASVKAVKHHAFYQCTGLESLTIPSPVETIEPQAFYGCSWITDLKIADSVQSIDVEAFRGCSHLKTLSLGNGLEWISYGAFEDCTSLESLVIPDSVKFVYINNGWSINPVDFNNNMGAFQNCTSLKTVKLGRSMYAIAPLTFRGCTALQTVIIGDSVESIGEYTFDGCRSLKNIQWGGCEKEVKRNAFSNCSRITTMTFPSPIEAIGESAFENCTGLTGITLGTSVLSIGTNAFKGCSYLTRLELGETLEYIYPGAFQNCTSLAYVKIPDSVKILYASNLGNQGAFQGCTALNKVILGKRVEGIASYTFAGCTSLKDVTMGESIEYVWNYAFSDCTALSSINFENANLKSVGDWTFYNCSNLDSVRFGDKLTSMGNYVFNNSGIRYLTLPATLQSMGSYIFRFCSDFGSLTMLADIPPTIGYDIFGYTNDTYTIIVPHDSLLRYRDAWSAYSSHIIASNN